MTCEPTMNRVFVADHENLNSLPQKENADGQENLRPPQLKSGVPIRQRWRTITWSQISWKIFPLENYVSRTKRYLCKHRSIKYSARNYSGSCGRQPLKSIRVCKTIIRVGPRQRLHRACCL